MLKKESFCLHSLLCFQEGFQEYLQSMKGGRHKKTVAERHAFQTYSILKRIKGPLDKSGTKVIDLVEQKVKSEEWSPSTSRTYLYSLKLYIKYLCCLSALGQTHCDCVLLREISENINTWAKSLKKAAIEQKKPPTADDFLSPNEIRDYMQCQRTNRTRELLRKEHNSTITPRVHAQVRNYLLFCIALSNAHRTGCLLNMLLTEFNSAIEKRGHMVVYVADHKTRFGLVCPSLVYTIISLPFAVLLMDQPALFCKNKHLMT